MIKNTYCSLNETINLLTVHKAQNTPCPQKVSQMLFTGTLKVDKRIPSNLAHGVRVQCLTMRHENYPLHLTHVCTLPCKVVRVRSVKNSVILLYR